MKDDAEFFKGIIESFADEGKDVLLFAHSYGGIAATEAAKGLGKAEREAQGKPGGIVRIVYLSALVVAEGTCLIDELGPPPAGFMEIDQVCLAFLGQEHSDLRLRSMGL